MKSKPNKEIQSDAVQLTQRKLLLKELFPEKLLIKKSFSSNDLYLSKFRREIWRDF